MGRRIDYYDESEASAELADLPMDRSMRMRIYDFLGSAGRPHLG